MAQIVKLRRSSVSGQKPTNTNLQLGELALNTTDGKVYMAKSGSLGPSVEELISTNTVNTGSISLSGSITLEGNKIVTGSLYTSGSNKLIGNTQLTGSLTVSGSTTQIGNNTLFGTTLLSGSITISGSKSTTIPTVKIYGDIEQDGYTKYLPVNTNLDTIKSGSYIFVSGSTDDLYFAQNGKGYSNVTRLRWLEGNLYTGLLNGGIITATPGGTTFNVAAGSGIVVNLNASLTDNPYPTIKYVNWNTFTGQTLTYRTTHIQTFIGINDNGEIIQQIGAFNDGQYNTTISLGTVLHQNQSTVNASITYPNMAYGYKQRTYDFIKAFGPLKLSGLEIMPTGTLGLNVGSGTAWADGRNYQVDPNNPSYITDSGTAVSKIFRYYQVSGTTFVQDTNNASGYTSLDVTHYNNNGTLTTVPGNNGNNYEWTVQRVFWYPNSATKGIVVYYGNRTYTSATEAAANVQYEPFVEVENTKQNAVYLGAIAVRKDADWANTNTFLVLPGGVFRNVGGSGGGGTVPTARLTDLTDVDVAGATNGDIISYNTTSNKWEHGKQLTGSYQITGSLDITDSLLIGTGSLDNISPEKLHVENSGSYNIARFDGYHYSYAQINLQNHNSGSSASSDFVITADNGTENIHYVDLGINSSTYNAGYVGYENDAYLLNAGKDLYVGTVGGSGHPSNLNLFAQNSWENPQIIISGSKQISFNTGSVSNDYQYEFSGSIKADHDLNVVGDITGSNISGSFIGDGSRLYNIPMSGVTGIELNKIVSGSVSASISPDNGLQINTDVYIDGTLTAKELHIDYVTSSVLFQSGSTKFGDTSDDNHNFTGSVYIDGNLNVNSITGSIDFSNLTNVPTLVSGSSQISYTGITNVPNGIVSGSSQILDGSGIWSGSAQLPNGVVSGSSQISYTGITDVPNGIVSSSQQVIDLGFTTTDSFESFTSSYTSASSSFDTRIDSIYGSVTGLTENFNSHTSSYMSFTSSFESYTSSYNNFTSSVVLASQTSSMTVLSSSYALTASYALNGGGGGTEGRTAKLDQTLASSTWTFGHNLGEKYPAIEIFDNNDYVVIPTSIQAIDDNTLTIIFSSPVSGVATATVGGGIPFISGSYNGRVLAVNDGGPMWKDGMVSGSLQIEEFGFSTTGSNSFVGNQTVTGSLTVRNAKLDATCVTVSTGTTIFDLSDFDGATFDYVVKNGGNMRAGTIVSVWDGAVSSYNETSTLDLGDTSNITFEVSGTGELNTVIAGGTWTVQVLYRALGCTS
jgi:hypothetical protein